ncbi:MAG TPA: alpha/beta hydrolase [Pseudomonadales bacterium]|nr:alpha/beta hydrolase [Pseudomonadales bacterium]
MAFAQLSNVKLEYFQFGDGPAKVLFIHGFQASARIWHAVQQALPADQYTSIAINNRGAGASDAPADEHEYGIPQFAADALELVNGLGWREFTLVGHSLGGATVAQMAVDAPERISGLVLLDPADPDGRGGTPEEIDTIIETRMAARREQQVRGGGGDGIDARNMSGAPEWMRLLTADINAAPEQRLRGSMRSMFKVRLGDRVKTLPMPVLLIGGDADALIPLASMLGTYAKYPKGTGLHMWHGVGHSPNVDRPEAFVEVLRHFMEVTVPARQ